MAFVPKEQTESRPIYELAMKHLADLPKLEDDIRKKAEEYKESGDRKAMAELIQMLRARKLILFIRKQKTASEAPGVDQSPLTELSPTEKSPEDQSPAGHSPIQKETPPASPPNLSDVPSPSPRSSSSRDSSPATQSKTPQSRSSRRWQQPDRIPIIKVDGKWNNKFDDPKKRSEFEVMQETAARNYQTTGVLKFVDELGCQHFVFYDKGLRRVHQIRFPGPGWVKKSDPKQKSKEAPSGGAADDWCQAIVDVTRWFDEKGSIQKPVVEKWYPTEGPEATTLED